MGCSGCGKRRSKFKEIVAEAQRKKEVEEQAKPKPISRRERIEIRKKRIEARSLRIQKRQRAEQRQKEIAERVN